MAYTKGKADVVGVWLWFLPLKSEKNQRFTMSASSTQLTPTQLLHGIAQSHQWSIQTIKVHNTEIKEPVKRYVSKWNGLTWAFWINI